MMMMLSGATVTARRLRKRHTLGELVVPSNGNTPDSLRLEPGRWAMDNGAFLGFEPDPFLAMLQRFYRRPGCRFCCAPDVVGDAYATQQQWPFWSRLIRGVGFPPAYVAQDGLTVDAVPWAEIAALFIGGHTEWKTSIHVQQLVAYAKARGIWVHMGRVNSRARLYEAAQLGCDSFDGTKFSRYPDLTVERGLTWAHEATTHAQQPTLQY